MDKLLEALETRRYFNNMPFSDFVKEYEKWSGKTVDLDEIREWRFMGLNNTDFLLDKIE
jgi:hypothetical protein